MNENHYLCTNGSQVENIMVVKLITGTKNYQIEPRNKFVQDVYSFIQQNSASTCYARHCDLKDE